MEIVLTILVLKKKAIEGNPSVILYIYCIFHNNLFMCDSRGINQTQINRRPHMSVLEGLLNCTTVKCTRLPRENTGSHFFGE